MFDQEDMFGTRFAEHAATTKCFAGCHTSTTVDFGRCGDEAPGSDAALAAPLRETAPAYVCCDAGCCDGHALPDFEAVCNANPECKETPSGQGCEACSADDGCNCRRL